ncbi:MAG TPA: DUF1684 domain-containing protein [Pyrinomonadaceae bacterium]|nr:DUF1684 domain-containing protein [Pyrinomonadaceae bacterium]
MKFFIFTITILLCLGACFAASAQDYYGTDNVKIFREGREKDFRNRQLSPLPPGEIAGFQGLKYFPVEANYRVRAIFTRTPDEKYFMLPTSSGRARKYKKVGTLSFKLGGEGYALGAYQSEQTLNDPKFEEYKSSLFIPFRDQTSGRETYGVGRYLYLAMPKDGETILDFNLAFNPSCAYGSSEFSCPLPPKENFLPIEIKAGEKNYPVKKEAVITKAGEKN